jgi:hypothetical protein
MSPIEVVDELEERRKQRERRELAELAEGVRKIVDWIRADPVRTGVALGIAALLGASLTADPSAKRR